MSDDMHEVTYVCANSKCGVSDKLRLFPNEPVPVAINCYRCHNGMGLKIDEMVIEQRGMFPQKRRAA
jgi:hypothetical protein